MMDKPTENTMDDLRERLIPIIKESQYHTKAFLHEYADDILAEIAKTHRLVRLDGGPHGTYSRYTNGRCRCDLCREANRERGRRYRKELKERGESVEAYGTFREPEAGDTYISTSDPVPNRFWEYDGSQWLDGTIDEELEDDNDKGVS